MASIAGEPAGFERRVTLRVRGRSAEGVPFSAEPSGEARVVGVESVATEAGRFDATRADLDVSGTGRLADGRLPYGRWRHPYWLVPRLGLPLAMPFEEWIGNEMPRRERHELTAADALAIGRVLALERWRCGRLRTPPATCAAGLQCVLAQRVSGNPHALALLPLT